MAGLTPRSYFLAIVREPGEDPREVPLATLSVPTKGVFAVAGAIMAENALSFLGFGVREPGASWGELLHQAFSDPLTYWHLTLFPGAAIFLAVISFNFISDGIGKAISPK